MWGLFFYITCIFILSNKINIDKYTNGMYNYAIQKGRGEDRNAEGQFVL